VDLITASLNAGNNVVISTGAGGGQPGNITILTDIGVTGAFNVSLTLNAHNNIVFDAEQSFGQTVSSTGSSLDLILNPDLASGGGQVIFNTGVGNSYPLAINTNGGLLQINGDSSVVGESVTTLIDTNWIINPTDTLTISESFIPATLNLQGSSVLQNDGSVQMANGAINGDSVSVADTFINNGELLINDFSTSTSVIDSANLNFNQNSYIEIFSLNTLSLTSNQLDLPIGTGLTGGGTLDLQGGTITVNGGVIYPGEMGNYAFANQLTINGDVTFNSGGLISVLGSSPVPDLVSTELISTGSISIIGGDLITIWDSSSDPTQIVDFMATDLLSCQSTPPCLSGVFTTPVDAMGILTSTPDYTFNSGSTLNYEITDIDDGSSLIRTTGVSGNWDNPAVWQGGNVPGINDYVIVDNVDPEVFITIDSPQLVRGMQSFGNIDIQSGGELIVNGDIFIVDDIWGADGVLSFNAVDARISGTGVLYAMPGAKVDLNQGILAKDMVNWGLIHTSPGTPFQIDSILVNQSLFALNDAVGVNDFTGIGSIDNHAIFSFGNGAELNLSGGLSLNVSSAAAQFNGQGVLSLNSGSSLDIGGFGLVDLAFLQSLNVNNASVFNVHNALLPATVNLSAGVLQGNGSLTLGSTTQVNVLQSSSLSGIDSNNLLVIDNDANFVVGSGQSLLLDNASFINSLGTLTGAGEVVVPVDSSLSANDLVDVARIVLAGGTLIANDFTYDGILDWQGQSMVNGFGTGLTTTGVVNLSGGSLNTDWTIAPTSTVLWDFATTNVLVLNDVDITNRGVFRVNSVQASPKGLNQSGTLSTFINEGVLLIDATDSTVLFDVGFDNIGGKVALMSGSFSLNGAPLVLDQADEALMGNGAFIGSVDNQGGLVSPGINGVANIADQTGTLFITGDYSQIATSTLEINLDSTFSGLLNDRLIVGGQLNADGEIKFGIINNKSIAEIALLIDQSFSPLTATSVAGRFSEVTIPSGLNFSLSDTGVITITSDNLLLNSLSNELEILLSSDGLTYTDIVQELKFIDQRFRISRDGEEDEENGAPRLVCK